MRVDTLTATEAREYISIIRVSIIGDHPYHSHFPSFQNTDVDDVSLQSMLDALVTHQNEQLELHELVATQQYWEVVPHA